MANSKLVDVTIRMPEEWVDAFWGWYLDGGGDDGFSETLSNRVVGYEPGEGYSDRHRKERLIIHSDRPITAKQKRR